MSSTIEGVLQQLRTIIGELDQAAATASGAEHDVRKASSFFEEAATGSAHPQMYVARQEIRVAADKAGKVARLLSEAAKAFAEYVDCIAPGTVSPRTAAPEAMPSGEQLSESSGGRSLLRRLANRLATTPNSDDGLEDIGTIGNNVQDALRPGGIAAPRPPEPVYRSMDTDGVHVGDALVAAFVVTLVGIRASETAARLYRKARPYQSEEI